METDMSPIDDSIDHPYFEHLNPAREQRQQYQQQQPIYYEQQPQSFAPAPVPSKPFDIFSYLDKTVWVIILVIFIIGFFMGKTMQPVFIKTG